MLPVQLFKCLSDETRLRCVALLHQRGKLCVCELTTALQLSQPKISRHLALMRQCGLLLDSREGQWVFYQLNRELPEWVFSVLTDTLMAAEMSRTFQNDLKQLNKMPSRLSVSIC